MDKPRLGFAMTGSFCTFGRVMTALENIAARGEFDIVPIMSENAASTDTRFGASEYWRGRLASASGKPVITTIAGAEPIGPKKSLDALVIAPCTGNTLAKLAAGIADTSVTMAVKAQLRNRRPVVIAVSTNDALSTAAKNIGELRARRNVYFVSMSQDDPLNKPDSMVAEMEKIYETLLSALSGGG